MADHKANTPSLKSLSKRQWARIAAGVASVALVCTGGVVTRNFYAAPHASETHLASVSDNNVQAASRGNAREQLGADTSYVNVVINGKSRRILGQGFTDVKSVLDAGDITLDPHDTVTPSLKTKVDESTTITINRAGADVETSEEKIPFNVVKKESADLPKGTEKVETEGQEGILEKTNLVTKSGDKTVSSNTFATYLKKAPVNKVILVGTAEPKPAAQAPAQTNNNTQSQPKQENNAPSNNVGTTAPVGEMQQWAHDYLLSNGYSEADFTATVFIITRESGWNPTVANPSSGAYGLPQALPGSKMSSEGADWATNYQTQLKWFWKYCAQRYGSIQGAYAYWQANHCY